MEEKRDSSFSDHDILTLYFLGYEGFVYVCNEGSMKIQDYGWMRDLSFSDHDILTLYFLGYEG